MRSFALFTRYAGTTIALDTVDDMIEWFDDHKGTMDVDTRIAYLCEVRKIQADIRFYQGINARLLKEDFDA